MSTAEQEMLDLFVQEASEHLTTLETDLLALEASPRDADLLNRLFRAVHSVKGTAGFFGLVAITDLAHVMESVMALVRDGQMASDARLVSVFLAATDKLRAMVAAPGACATIDASAENTSLQALLRREPPALPPEQGPVLPAYLHTFRIDPELVRSALRHGQNIFVLQLRLHADIEARGQTILKYLAEVESLGVFIDAVTDLESVTGLDDTNPPELVCSLLFATAMETDLLVGAFDLPADQVIQVPSALLREWQKTQPTLAPAQTAPAPTLATRPPAEPNPVTPASLAPASVTPAPPPAAESGAATPIASPSRGRAEETVRISVSLLDTLMNLAGEMVLGRNQLVRAVAHQSATAESLPALVQNISGVTSDLQRTIMRARLQPVGGLLAKFGRVVRDLGQKLGKDLLLETVGDEVELDRALIEGLSDPLTHLVRNAADHGIETPDERRRAGKAASGRIRIAASHLAGRVQLEVRDDGRGLDPARLKAKAIEKGLLTPEHAARLGDTEAWQLIFAPGFSTAAVVSDVSGRGVGMDVVKTNIERLGGRVEIQSAVGQGTAVIIRLPLTLAIVPALVVGCGTRRFAVPQLNLEEIVRPAADRPVEDYGGSRVLRLREELLPVLDLGELLGLPPFVTPANPGYVLVLALDHRRFGLRVETVAESEEIVVKPLGRHFQGVPFYSGATLLGQGEIALILDVAGLAAGRLPAESSAPAALADASVVREDEERVLLFRDTGPETFALHLANVGRIERIDTTRIESVGGLLYLRRPQGPALRLLRLGDFLPITAPTALPAEVHVIVPRLVHHPVALLATAIHDAAGYSRDLLDQRSVSAQGLLGAVSLHDRLTLVLDIYGLLARAGLDNRPALAPGAALASRRVLLAEDTAFFREAVRRALEGVVSSLDIAPDGEEAWTLLQAGRYDVLVTDLEMPRLDGFGLASRVRADARLRNLPIMALSARDNPDFHARARAAGIDHYETKLDRERLQAALSRLLQNPVS